jgi:predicted RNA-binding Zn ribbon-like protein
VDFATYAERAVQLVNTNTATPGEPAGDRLSTVADLVHLLPEWPALAEAATRRDLTTLRSLRSELHEVFRAGAAGDDADVVARLNALLAEHPMRPEISGHDNSSWHLHAAGPGASLSAVVAAEALMGLTMTVIDLGADRFGVCNAPGCERVYLDTSRNRSRRFCSDRCSTRVAVAAHRARQRADPRA